MHININLYYCLLNFFTSAAADATIIATIGKAFVVSAVGESGFSGVVVVDVAGLSSDGFCSGSFFSVTVIVISLLVIYFLFASSLLSLYSSSCASNITL